MKIAFYAPMKPLDHPVPSGDRELGRALVTALEGRGHEVRTASRFRAWSGEGGEEAQQALAAEAAREVPVILERWRGAGWRPDLILTYHLYHKAPDWIGPALAEATGAPYAIVEASRALKRRDGPFAVGFAAADAALKRADAVFALHEDDAAGLAAIVPAERLHLLPPFIDAAPFAAVASDRPPGRPMRLLTVAMMRAGDKEASYDILAAALARLEDHAWHLTIAGDGPARDRILSRFPQARITALGAVARAALPAVYGAADIFLWPAVREAFGLVFLEAQAAGLPVVAGAAGGVPAIVRHGETGLIVPVGDSAAFAAAAAALIDDPDRVRRMGAAARRHVLSSHDIGVAGRRLEDGLAALVSA